MNALLNLLQVGPDRVLRDEDREADSKKRINMIQNQIAIRSTEQRLAGWIVYTIIAVPMIAMVLRDIGVGPLARWIVYATIAVPMIAMVSQRDIGVGPVRWVLYAIIAVPMIDVLSRW